VLAVQRAQRNLRLALAAPVPLKPEARPGWSLWAKRCCSAVAVVAATARAQARAARATRRSA
jgi:hypothetical protein